MDIPHSALPTPHSDGSALRAPHSDADAFSRLASLPAADYDRVRHDEAKRLHIRIQTLDAEVAKRRAELVLQAQASAVKLPPIQPWPEPVQLGETLDQVSSRFTRYTVLPLGAPDALALWSSYSHAFQAFYLSPRLSLYSYESGCGKTTTLDLLATLVPRPLRAENLSPPVLFRMVHLFYPTLLLDEVDSYLTFSEELRGLLNAGHKRGAAAYRCEGDNYSIRVFNAFAPAALAGLGLLPATLLDRSIRILLVPALPGQIPERFDPLNIETETILARKLARWAADNSAALAASNPVLPATAFNRLADNWRPLFAIAQLAGGDWPQRTLDAFAHLTARAGTDNSHSALRTPDSTLLLADLRRIFLQSGVPRLFSSALVKSLCALPNRPWSANGNGGKSITKHSLARHLAPLGIRPRLFRIGHHRGKGYDLADLPQDPAPDHAIVAAVVDQAQPTASRTATLSSPQPEA